MSGFFDMGGYGPFVWPAYGLVIVTLLGVALASWRRERRKARLLRQLEGDARAPGNRRVAR